MKTQKILWIFLICLLLLSCRNTKEIIKSETEVKTYTEQVKTKTQDAKADTKTVKVIAEKITEADSTVIKETVIELSKPDSAGQQYAEKITERIISTGKNKETKTDTKEEVVKATENKVIETETKTENQVITSETDTKTVKKHKAWKIIMPIIIVLVGAGFALYKFKGGAIKSLISKIKPK